jgi:hypothetical protein
VRRYTLVIGMAALGAGGLILIRDLVQVHSIAYAVAGVGMLAFGAWRLQAAGRGRP